MFKKTAISLALSSLLFAAGAQSATVYENEKTGDKIDVYGEVGVGGHFSPNEEFAEFYEQESYIDDSFATMGIKGNYSQIYYRLELDYERENWKYGSGDMVLAIDKMFIGYKITENHAVEFGITDTALDDYDKFGDFTFDTTVETGEAGDQANTAKYEMNYSLVKAGISYSYQGTSSSGDAYGDVVNGYVGIFTDYIDVAVGAEKRAGSEGKSKYGKQTLYTLGARGYIGDLSIGINGYIEDEDIAQHSSVIKVPDFNDLDGEKSYNDYQTLRNQGGLVSAKYDFTQQWAVTASYNYEEFEKWDINSPYSPLGKTELSWGKERIWQTIGVNFKPYKNTIFAIEANFGEAAQDAYAYGRVYF